MDKTLHSKFTGKSTKDQNKNVFGDAGMEDIISLMQEMKALLKDAANELMQPRKEVVEKLLKKVHH